VCIVATKIIVPERPWRSFNNMFIVYGKTQNGNFGIPIHTVLTVQIIHRLNSICNSMFLQVTFSTYFQKRFPVSLQMILRRSGTRTQIPSLIEQKCIFRVHFLLFRRFLLAFASGVLVGRPQRNPCNLISSLHL